MRILVDTNILLDHFQERDPFYSDAEKVLEICTHDNVQACIAAHTVLNAFFILRKYLSDSERRAALLGLTDIFEIIGIDSHKVVSALRKDEFKDFEDCLQDECAYEFSSDYIITRNKDDFKTSTVPAVTPSEFFEIIGKLA